MGPARRTLALAGWCGLLAAVVAWSWAAPAGLGVATAGSPLLASVSLLRLTLAGLATYLAAVTVLAILARILCVPRLGRLAHAVTVPLARRFLAGTLGLGLVAAAAPATAPAADGPVVVGAPGPAAAPVMRPLPPAGTAPTMTPVPTSEAGTVAPHTWTVRSGDHLWSIASSVLADAHGAPVDDDTVVPYWRHLVAANRHRFVDTDNPDLLLPGQVLVVPPVSSVAP